MKFFSSKFTYEHAWTDVAQAHWMKYPNPFASHVLASDVLERRLISTPGIEFGTSFSGLRSLISPNFQAPSPADSLENRKDFSVIRSFDRNNGVDFSEKLYSTRVFLKTGILPRWIRNLLPQLGLPAPSQAYIVEHSLLDPENKTLHTITRNLSHKKLLYVEEEQIFKQHPENPKWTLVEVNVRVESSIGGGWLRPKIEAMGVKRFDDQSKRSRKGFQWVLERLDDKRRQFDTLISSAETHASSTSSFY